MIKPTESASLVFHFADVEVHEADFSVTKAGMRLALEPKPLCVLLYLLHHTGRVVRKDELLDAVWGDTAVTESSLTRVIALLRQALGDDPHEPRFIETVATVGYRFICAVVCEERAPGFLNASEPEQVTTADEALNKPVDSDQPAPAEKDPRRMTHRRWAIVAGAVCLLLLAAAYLYLRRPLPPLRITSYAQLTNDGRIKEIIGTDGNNLYLNLYRPAGHATVPVSGGRLTELSIDLPTTRESPGDFPNLLSVSPDGSALLVGSNWDWTTGWNLWVVGTHGSTARYLARAEIATWSPDSSTVVYMTRRGDLYTIPAEGGESRLLYTSPSPKVELRWAGDIAWSPDGRKIRFVRWGRYWEISPDGKNAHEVVPGWPAANPKQLMWQGKWTPDGAFFLFTARSMAYSQDFAARPQVWALDERRKWLHRPNPEPIQLTNGATDWGVEGLAISKDRKVLFVIGDDRRGELLIYNASSKGMMPYLGGISAEFVDFSKDGKYLVYVTFPDGVMWRANRDGTGVMQLTRPPLRAMNPRWSPDGSQILFSGQYPFELTKIYTIPNQGGTPKRLLPGDADEESIPTWSPDGTKVVFVQVSAGRLLRTRILELASGKITDLPAGPGDPSAMKWSPAGRYFAGMAAHGRMALFDLQTNQWTLFKFRHGSFNCIGPTWSRDGRFIYFESIDSDQNKASDPGLYRVPVHGDKPEKIVDLRGFTSTGTFEVWFGLDPDDNPLLLRNAGTSEIYALTLEPK